MAEVKFAITRSTFASPCCFTGVATRHSCAEYELHSRTFSVEYSEPSCCTQAAMRWCARSANTLGPASHPQPDTMHCPQLRCIRQSRLPGPLDPDRPNTYRAMHSSSSCAKAYYTPDHCQPDNRLGTSASFRNRGDAGRREAVIAV